jgi:hypothetical protein
LLSQHSGTRARRGLTPLPAHPPSWIGFLAGGSIVLGHGHVIGARNVIELVLGTERIVAFTLSGKGVLACGLGVDGISCRDCCSEKRKSDWSAAGTIYLEGRYPRIAEDRLQYRADESETHHHDSILLLALIGVRDDEENLRFWVSGAASADMMNADGEAFKRRC